jgi:hypothetical protein
MSMADQGWPELMFGRSDGGFLRIRSMSGNIGRAFLESESPSNARKRGKDRRRARACELRGQSAYPPSQRARPMVLWNRSSLAPLNPTPTGRPKCLK